MRSREGEIHPVSLPLCSNKKRVKRMGSYTSSASSSNTRINLHVDKEDEERFSMTETEMYPYFPDPESVYAQAELELPEISDPEEDQLFYEISELLKNKLVTAINDLVISEDDPEEAEEQMRTVVHSLQLTAFLAGAIWEGETNSKKINEYLGSQDNDEEVVTVQLSTDNKLELAKALLNDSGIRLTLK